MKKNRFKHCFVALLAALLTLPTATCADADDAKAKPAETKAKKKTDGKKWTDLTGSWEKCQFGGDGEIEIKGKMISLGFGDPITGVVWKGKIPRDNYEIEIEGRRTEGFDFFCAVTFPVAKSHASLVLGGWGGGVVGISSIDDRDASDNQTTMFRDFKNNQWYRARIRIEETRLVVWIDDKLQFEHPRKDHKFDIRYEMDPCTPFGLANYQCKSEIRKVRIRQLAKEELGEDIYPKKKSDKKTGDKPAEKE